MQERNIAVCIVLTILTCGIYGLYWMVCLADDICRISRRTNTGGGLVLVLSLVTCGIYGLYWLYVSGESIDDYKRERGINTSYTGLIYLVLSLLGVGIISYALMQNELNQIANSNYGQI